LTATSPFTKSTCVSSPSRPPSRPAKRSWSATRPPRSRAAGDAVKALLQGPGKSNADAANRAVQIRPALADVIVFSGCLDHQTSADATIGGKPTGAMSWALIEVFNASLDLTYVDLLKQVRQKLDGKFQQIPQMSSGSKLKLADVKFIM
jgi:hypothetical protein